MKVVLNGSGLRGPCVQRLNEQWGRPSYKCQALLAEAMYYGHMMKCVLNLRVGDADGPTIRRRLCELQRRTLNPKPQTLNPKPQTLNWTHLKPEELLTKANVEASYLACASPQYPVPKGPRTQIIGFRAPNTINIIVFGPLDPYTVPTYPIYPPITP